VGLLSPLRHGSHREKNLLSIAHRLNITEVEGFWTRIFLPPRREAGKVGETTQRSFARNVYLPLELRALAPPSKIGLTMLHPSCILPIEERIKTFPIDGDRMSALSAVEGLDRGETRSSMRPFSSSVGERKIMNDSAELAANGTAVGPHDLIIAATRSRRVISSPLATNAAFRKFRRRRINGGGRRNRSSTSS